MFVNKACALSAIEVNLGDCVVLQDAANLHDPRNGRPGIVIGIQDDAYVVAMTQAYSGNGIAPPPAWYEKSLAGFGVGFPWNDQVVFAGSMLVIDKQVVLKYVESAGSLEINADRVSATFYSERGWVCPVLLGTPINDTDLEGIRLQGLQSQGGLIERPVITPCGSPALPGELGCLVVYEKYTHQDLWEGLGIAVCPLTVASFTEIPLVPAPAMSNCIGSYSLPFQRALQPESMAAYINTRAGVIRRLDCGQLESGIILAFANGTCFELPCGEDWASMAHLPLRIAGFMDCLVPDSTCKTVYANGIEYIRLGFLTAPMVALPCSASQLPSL